MVGFLNQVGPGLGYFPNPKKTWLVVKPEFLNEATEIFKDTGIASQLVVRGILVRRWEVSTSKRHMLRKRLKSELGNLMSFLCSLRQNHS